MFLFSLNGCPNFAVDYVVGEDVNDLAWARLSDSMYASFALRLNSRAPGAFSEDAFCRECERESDGGGTDGADEYSGFRDFIAVRSIDSLGVWEEFQQCVENRDVFRENDRAFGAW